MTVNSRDEPGTPPRTYTFGVQDTVRGRLSTRIPVSPDKHYDIYTSTTTGDPPVPSESRLTLLDAVGGGSRKPPVVQQALVGLGRLVAALRGCGGGASADADRGRVRRRDRGGASAVADPAGGASATLTRRGGDPARRVRCRAMARGARS